MRKLNSALLVLTLATSLAASTAAPTSALPLGGAATGEIVTQLDELSSTVQVRSSRSARIAAGIMGGLIVGGIIASHWPYRYGYYYDPYYYPYAVYPIYPPYRVYRGYPLDAAIAYCARRFKSYDPYSMTYLGYDGRRRRCP